MKKVVIVESPSKTKKISQFLGKDYEVLSSVGHIRDLPKSQLGVEVEKDFEPSYVIDKAKKDVIDKLKSAVKKSDTVYLATDPDREGEAIAWHVGVVLNDNKALKVNKSEKNLDIFLDKIKNNQGDHPKLVRVTFNSITKEAVQEAFKSPRPLDYDLIDAQQARRILDRLVGYKLSPLLWSKIRYGLSAGRVQSVAVRLIVEREREIEKFPKEPYFEILSDFAKKSDLKSKVNALLVKIDEKNVYTRQKFNLFAGEYVVSKTIIDTKAKAEQVIDHLNKTDHYEISDVIQKETKKYPSPPFTTSTMQQSANGNLGLSPQKTMQLAQKLYEEGHITYMRTDSTHIVPTAISEIRDYVKNALGVKYLPTKEVYYKHKAGLKTQEAHEAIRPTHVNVKADDLPKSVNPQQVKLYNLIWQRTVASQMTPAIYSNTKFIIKNKTNNHVKVIYTFDASGSVIVFDGYTKVYKSKKEDVILPDYKKGDLLDIKDTKLEEKLLSPPPRYNESSLIKELEKFNIGRPSTYATIIHTIQTRGYVKNQNRVLYPTDSGLIVNDLLVKHFNEIVDVDFTSNMEDGLDKIAVGEESMVELLKNFYGPFEKRVGIKMKEIKKEDIVVVEKTDEKCPECKEGHLVIKLGKFGKFYSCDRFPDCKFAKPMEEAGDVEGTAEDNKILDEIKDKKCPECGGELVLKEGRYGKFVACGNYPKCKYTQKIENKINMKCPKCGDSEHGEVVVKRTKRGKIFFGCSRYPKCDYASWTNPSLPEAKQIKSKRKSINK